MCIRDRPKGDHTGTGSLWGTRLTEKPGQCDDSVLESPAINLSAQAGKPLKLSFWSWASFRSCDSTKLAGFCKAVCEPFVPVPVDAYSGGAFEVLVNGVWTPVAPTGGYQSCLLYTSRCV